MEKSPSGIRERREAATGRDMLSTCLCQYMCFSVVFRYNKSIKSFSLFKWFLWILCLLNIWSTVSTLLLQTLSGETQASVVISAASLVYKLSKTIYSYTSWNEPLCESLSVLTLLEEMQGGKKDTSSTSIIFLSFYLIKYVRKTSALIKDPFFMPFYLSPCLLLVWGEKKEETNQIWIALEPIYTNNGTIKSKWEHLRETDWYLYTSLEEIQQNDVYPVFIV